MPVSWAVRKFLNYRHSGREWGEDRVVIKIEAESEDAVSAASLELGDAGTPRPGSDWVTYSWESRREPCGSLPASSGSLWTLLGSPPLLNCSACSSPSFIGQNGSNVGKQRVGRSCLEQGSRNYS